MRKPNFIKVTTMVATGALMLSTLTPVAAYCAPLTAIEAQQVITSSTAKLSRADIALLKKMFDADFFATKYPQIVSVIGTDSDALFNYFVTYGIWEGKQLCADFDVQAYAAGSPDLAAAFTTDLMKYYRHYDQYKSVETRPATKEACIAVGITEATIKSFVIGIDADGTPRFVKGTPQTSEDRALKITAVSENGHAVAAPIGTSITDLAKIGSSHIEAQLNSVSGSTAPDVVVETPVSEVSPFGEGEGGTVHRWNPTQDQIDVYVTAHQRWLSQMPDATAYMNDTEYGNFTSAMFVWESREPQVADYMAKVYSGIFYDTLADAEAAYDLAYTAWEAEMPKACDYMTPDEQEVYAAAIVDWQNAEPCIDDMAYELYDNDAFNLAHGAWESNKPVQSDYKIYTSADEGTWATGTEAKAAYDAAMSAWTIGQTWENTIPSDYTALIDFVWVGEDIDGKLHWGACEQDLIDTNCNTHARMIYPRSDINAQIAWSVENANMLSDDEAALLVDAATTEDDALAAERELAKPAGYVEGSSAPAESDYFTAVDDTDAYGNAMDAYLTTNPEPVKSKESEYYIGQDNDAYDADESTWVSNNPEYNKSNYMTSDEYNNYQSDVVDYITDAPTPYQSDFHYVGDGFYANEDDAQSAYEADYDQWSDESPANDSQAFLEDTDGRAAYEAEIENWGQYEPVLSESEIDNHGYDSDDSSDWEYVAPSVS